MSRRTAITERDLQRLLHIIACPADTDTADGLPLSIMIALRELIPSDYVSFDLCAVDQRTYFFEQEVGDVTPIADEDQDGLYEAYWTHYWDSPPCVYPDISGDLISITTTSDFHSDRELRSTAMYSEVMRPIGVERSLMACFPSQPGRSLRLLFFRGPGPDFSPRDRSILALLRPHLMSAYREQRLRQSAKPQLTGRHLQVLQLVAAGCTNGQIARRLSITESTVRKHLEHIFERMQVNSRTAAVTRAFGNEP